MEHSKIRARRGVKRSAVRSSDWLAAVQHDRRPDRTAAGAYRSHAVLRDPDADHRPRRFGKPVVGHPVYCGDRARRDHAQCRFAGRRVQPSPRARSRDDGGRQLFFGGSRDWRIRRGATYFGGSIPLAISLVMLFALPESLHFLAVREKSLHKIRRWLQRIDPSAPAGESTRYVLTEKAHRGVPWVQLFHEGRALGTVLIWLLNFMNLLNLYFLTLWLPTVVADIGYSAPVAVRVGATLQLAGAIGAFLQGWLIHRFGFVPVLATGFGLATLNIALIGYPGISLALLVVVVSIAGLGVVGGQSGVNAFSATFYPTDIRSTGVGAGLGVGRVGAIVGPYLGGQLIALHWTNQQLFLASAVPALISAIVMAALHWVVKPKAVAAPLVGQASAYPN